QKSEQFRDSVDIKPAEGEAKITQKDEGGQAGLYKITARDKITSAVTAEEIADEKVRSRP
ncbi:MAG: hypothetical protein Q8P07_01810, partial [bacterium]|nr:hypothetical protein [bacterium]